MAYIAKLDLDDRGDHPGDINVSVIISLLYSYLLYTVFYEHHSYCGFMCLFTLIIVLINIIFYLCVLKCLYILPLYILCIYSFMYWKSGTRDLLVLMLFVLQCTDYKYNFLTLTLTLTSSCTQSWVIPWQPMHLHPHTRISTCLQKHRNNILISLMLFLHLKTAQCCVLLSGSVIEQCYEVFLDITQYVKRMVHLSLRCWVMSHYLEIFTQRQIVWQEVSYWTWRGSV